MTRRRPTRGLALLSLALLLWGAAPATAEVGSASSGPTRVDTIPPAISLAAVPPHLVLLAGQDYTFSWNVAETNPSDAAGANVAMVLIPGWTSTPMLPYDLHVNEQAWTWSAPDFTSGDVRVLVTARDAFGHVTVVASAPFTILAAATDVPDAPVTGPALAAPAPNPFNPSTRLEFTLAASGRATIAVYAPDGRRVRRLVDDVRGAGRHAVVWDGRDDAGRPVAAGTYLVRLDADGRRLVQRAALVK